MSKAEADNIALSLHGNVDEVLQKKKKGQSAVVRFTLPQITVFPKRERAILFFK